MASLKIQMNSVPVDKNYIVLTCTECNINAALIHKKDYASGYTCPICYRN
jgi:hypothetical protein